MKIKVFSKNKIALRKFRIYWEVLLVFSYMPQFYNLSRVNLEHHDVDSLGNSEFLWKKDYIIKNLKTTSNLSLWVEWGGHVCVDQKTPCGSGFFYLMCSRGGTQVIMFGSKCLCLMSHPIPSAFCTSLFLACAFDVTSRMWELMSWKVSIVLLRVL